MPEREQFVEIIRDSRRRGSKLTIAKDRISIKPKGDSTPEEEDALADFAEKINAIVQPVPFTLRGKVTRLDDGAMYINMSSMHGADNERDYSSFVMRAGVCVEMDRGRVTHANKSDVCRSLEELLEKHYRFTHDEPTQLSIESEIRDVLGGQVASGRELITLARQRIRDEVVAVRAPSTRSPDAPAEPEVVLHELGPAKARLTIAKERITLKLSNTLSGVDIEHYVAFAKQIDAVVRPVELTLRGNFDERNKITLHVGNDNRVVGTFEFQEDR